MQKLLLILLLQLPFTASFSHANTQGGSERIDTIKLATTIMSPYQTYDELGQVQGTGINAIRCLEKATGLRFSIDVYPWKRAQELVNRGQYDGFFVGSKNKERDQYASYVGPLLHSFWHWYVPKDKVLELNPDNTPEKKDQVIGVVMGTNMHQWIQQKDGYEIIAHENSHKLFDLLKAGRIHYVLATGVMYESYQASEQTDFNILVAKSKPLGLYMGHQFVKRQKSNFELIKKGASECAPQ